MNIHNTSVLTVKKIQATRSHIDCIDTASTQRQSAKLEIPRLSVEESLASGDKADFPERLHPNFSLPLPRLCCPCNELLPSWQMNMLESRIGISGDLRILGWLDAGRQVGHAALEVQLSIIWAYSLLLSVPTLTFFFRMY